MYQFCTISVFDLVLVDDIVNQHQLALIIINFKKLQPFAGPSRKLQRELDDAKQQLAAKVRQRINDYPGYLVAIAYYRHKMISNH